MNSDPRAVMRASVAMASAAAVAETFNTLRREDELRTAQARESFEQFCRTEGLVLSEKPIEGEEVSAAWVEKTGIDVEQIVACTRYRDLLIMSRKSESHIGLTPAELGAAVLDVGRPVIIAPPGVPQHLHSKVGVAWKNSAEAARAVNAAMPLIERAAHIVIFSVNEDSDHATECIDCMEEIAESIRWHNSTVEVQYLVPGGRSVPQTLLEAAYDSNVDLLVTGAYGHSRLRELMFGGFTHRVLEETNFPVLLFH
jgi:nucleotide-binding universal stress UspA family protein